MRRLFCWGLSYGGCASRSGCYSTDLVSRCCYVGWHEVGYSLWGEVLLESGGADDRRLVGARRLEDGIRRPIAGDGALLAGGRGRVIGAE